MPEIVLHVGAFKTGTTYIQSALWANRRSLAQAGVLYPGGHRNSQSLAVKKLLDRERPRPSEGTNASPLPKRWQAIADEAAAWNGTVAIISMEFLAAVGSGRRREVVESFAPHPVRVVFAARPLTRLLPSQWQNTLRWGRAWRYEEYVQDVLLGPQHRSIASAHFWRRHHWPRILRRWQRTPGVKSVCFLIVPNAAPPDLLWHRFAAAAGIPPPRHDPPPRSNESLSAEAAELLRRYNMEGRDLADAGYQSRLRDLVALLRHTSQDSSVRTHRLGFPSQHVPRAQAITADLISATLRARPAVVGDVQELWPTADTRGAGDVAEPSKLSDVELLPLLNAVARQLEPRRAGPSDVHDVVDGTAEFHRSLLRLHTPELWARR